MTPLVELPEPQAEPTKIPIRDEQGVVARSAVTGRFVEPSELVAHPDTTVTEAVPKPTKRKAAKKRATTKPCPHCRKKPGLDPADYSKHCSRCQGSGKVKA